MECPVFRTLFKYTSLQKKRREVKGKGLNWAEVKEENTRGPAEVPGEIIKKVEVIYWVRSGERIVVLRWRGKFVVEMKLGLWSTVVLLGGSS